MLETALLIVILIALLGGILVLVRILERQRNDPSFTMLESRVRELTGSMDNKLQEVGRATAHQLTESVKMATAVAERLTKLDETNRQVVNVADNLKKFQDILTHPKQRGILGEYYLDTVLQNVLPPGTYALQYKFPNGEIVDAAIFYQDKIIPIDSKFSLENYNRFVSAETDALRDQYANTLRTDLKGRIDETAKYIRPENDTFDFAFMFIPSEALYYDLLVNKVGVGASRDLLAYAIHEKRVHIVSPTTFYAYLQTVTQAMRYSEISKSAEMLKVRLSEMSRHFAQYDNYMQKLGGSIGTTVNSYNKAYREFQKMDKDVFRITGDKAGIEALPVAGPSIEEE